LHMVFVYMNSHIEKFRKKIPQVRVTVISNGHKLFILKMRIH